MEFIMWVANAYTCSWTKLLPKSGNAFNMAIRHLNSVKLSDMAKEYSDLRRAVIETKLVLLTSMPSQIPQEQPSGLGCTDLSGPNWDTLFPQLTPQTFAGYGDGEQIPYDAHFE